MYVLIAALLLLVFFVKYVNVYMTIFVMLFYYMWWSDGREYTGEGRWEAFRTLRIWKWLSPVTLAFPYKTDLTATMGRRLFVFIPCSTPSPLIWAIGLHGGLIDFKHTIHYIVPAPYLWIPVMREVLLWTGAVTYSAFNPRYSQQEVILGLLNHGRSVCFSPSNFTNNLVDLENAIETRYPSDEVLSFAMAEKIQIFPVVVQGEHDRYRVPQNGVLKAVQAWMYEKIHYAFPMVYWYRLYNGTKPTAITVQFGMLMTPELYDTPIHLRNAMKEYVDKTVSTTLKDKQIKGM